MKAIFASKLYKSSKRKEEIKAALANPVNAELVQQLRTHLDPDYTDDKYDKQNQTEDVNLDDPSINLDDDSVEKVEDEGSKTGTETKDSSVKKIHSTPSPVDFHESNDDDIDIEKPEDDVTAPDEGKATEPTKDTEVDSSTKVVGQTVLYKRGVAPTLSISLDEIIGLLNLDEKTAGVSRAIVKDENELWVYYKDKINLNNVMDEVIARLDASDYTCLEFNRLARSDNAIVFEIEKASSKMVGEEDVTEE